MENTFKKNYLDGKTVWVPDWKHFVCFSTDVWNTTQPLWLALGKILALFSQCQSNFQFISDVRESQNDLY